MRGILIDPVNREVNVVETDGSLESMYELLTDENGPDVDMVERLHLGNRQFLWVDEEALLKPGPKYTWNLSGFHLIYGRALLLGETKSGEDSASTSLMLDEVKQMVYW